MPIGQTTSCSRWVIPEDQWIQEVAIGYNNLSINYFAVKTNEDQVFSRGDIVVDDVVDTVQFTQDEFFVGVYGYEDRNYVMTGVGFFYYKCVEVFIPDDEPEPVAPLPLPIAQPVEP